MERQSIRLANGAANQPLSHRAYWEVGLPHRGLLETKPFQTILGNVKTVPAMYSRRSVLQGSAVVLTGGLAGCSFNSDSPSEGRVAWISLTNDSDEQHEVRVTIHEGGGTDFFETYQLGTSMDSANAYVEDPVSGFGTYHVQATTSDQIASVYIPKWVDGDEQCVGVSFLIGTDGTLYWDVKSMQEC